MVTLLHIDNHIEPAWRCVSHAVSPPRLCLRVRLADYYVPNPPETAQGLVFHCLELVLTGRVLMCWTGAPVAASAVVGINRASNTLQLKTGDVVPCQITEREPTESEQAFIQQERLIEANLAIAEGLRGTGKMPKPIAPTPTVFAEKPEINETILWHVQQRIVDELDVRLKVGPSASAVFTAYCRDRLTLAEMERRYKWPYRVLKLRKAGLEEFLRERFNGLKLEGFFVDRSVFRGAERQMREGWKG